MLIDRCVIGADVQAYSQRNTRQQRDTQQDLQRVLVEAAQAAGLDRSTWETSHTGDGELAVLPADVNLLAVVGSFVPELHKLLVLRNEDRVPGTKIRSRLAAEVDPLAKGFRHTAYVHVPGYDMHTFASGGLRATPPSPAATVVVQGNLVAGGNLDFG